LWAASFGDHAVFGEDNSRYRHVGGRLRHKGYGRLRPANCRIKVQQNPMPEQQRWQNLFGDEKKLALALVEAFEMHMGRFLANEPGLEKEAARQKFYDSETITSLLNISDSQWRADEGDLRCARFHVPNQGFGNFTALRRAHYQKQTVDGVEQYLLPGAGRKTILDDFLQPVGTPPQQASADDEKLDVLLNPLAAIAP